MKTILKLARYLGPWADSRWPAAYERTTVQVKSNHSGEFFDAWHYQPHGQPVGAYLMAPGLHYDGPRDPRFDRACAALASSGFRVLAPFIPSYIRQIIDDSAVPDFESAYDAFKKLGANPNIFSVSFGSLLALRVASTRPVRRLMIFGGYADWAATVRYCLSGQTASGRLGDRDPLNQPVVFANLIATIPNAPAAEDHGAVLSAWNQYVRATWGRVEMKKRSRYEPLARSIGQELPPRLREFFYLGCGVVAGGQEAIDHALAQSQEKTARVNAAASIERIRCPVTIVHGHDDDVIPVEQALELKRRLPAACDAKVHITGLYGHSGSNWASLMALPQELRTMGAILRALAA